MRRKNLSLKKLVYSRKKDPCCQCPRLDSLAIYACDIPQTFQNEFVKEYIFAGGRNGVPGALYELLRKKS